MKDFSVIVPVYNVEEYLREALDSIVNQSIGFMEHIELIIVNDGSPDNSDAICREYADAYPDNVIYIEKPNGGVSSARNEGMKHMSGKYVTFMDSDDYWDREAFAEIYSFFETEGESVDLVAGRYAVLHRDGEIKFSHNLDYRFTENRIIDIEKEWDATQMAVNCIFVRREALKGRQFDTRLKISEDSIFVAPIILEKCRYAVVKSAVYYYRKRDDGGSAIDGKYKNLDWFFKTCDYSYRALMDYSMERFGRIIPYAQYQVMRDLMKSMSYHIAGIADAETVKRFGEYSVNLMKDVDDEIILAMRGVNVAPKAFALAHKYGKDITGEFAIRSGSLYFRELEVADAGAKSFIRIEDERIEDGRLILEGSCLVRALGDGFEVGFADAKDAFTAAEKFEVTEGDKIGYDGCMLIDREGFRVQIPLQKGGRYRLVLRQGDKMMDLRASAAAAISSEDFLVNYHRGVFESQANSIAQQSKEKMRKILGKAYGKIKK